MTITITMDDAHNIIATHIWLTQRPLDQTGKELSEGEIMDGMKWDGETWEYNDDQGN